MKKFSPVSCLKRRGCYSITPEILEALGIDPSKDEVRGHAKHYGPWQLMVSYRALCVSKEFIRTESGILLDTVETLWGIRTMSDCQPLGYEMEGRVSVLGKKRRAFTSSTMFELPNGHLISVATIHACIDTKEL